MKTNRTFRLISLYLSLLTLVACAPQVTSLPRASQFESATTTVTTSPVDKDPAFSQDQAKDLAFQIAQVTEDKVNNLVVTTDLDNGQPVYDIDFTIDGVDHSYTISAQDGKVLEQSQETAEPIQNSNLSAQDATAIALSDANLTQHQVTNLTVSQDNDNGLLVYDVSFRQGDQDYSYDIDAQTGAITARERDHVND